MRRLRTPFIAIKAPNKCKRNSHAVFVYLAGPNTSQFIIILHPFSLTLQLFIQKRTDFDQRFICYIKPYAGHHKVGIGRARKD